MRNLDQKQWFRDEPFQAFWEKSYRSMEVSSMGHPSFEVAEIASLLPSNAEILDLGCGEGRNALYLASRGFNVTAVDRSTAGIKKLKNISESLGFKIEVHVEDIERFPLEKQYDLVMAHGVLYYLDNPVWKKLLKNVKKNTKAGGFNIFTVFVYSESCPCPEEFHAAGYKGSFAWNELINFYLDWSIYRADQYVKWDAHPGVGMHYHPIEKLVARKPGGLDLKLSTLYQSLVENAHLGFAKAQGLDDHKSPHISNIGQLMIVQPRELSRSPNEHFQLEAGIPLELDCEPERSFFDSVKMGMKINELIKNIGEPQCIDQVFFPGDQYGVSHRTEGDNAAVIMKNYSLALWYYGKQVFYIVDGEVTGKAIYHSEPVRLKKG